MLISEEYRKLQQEMHKNPYYGKTANTSYPLVLEIIKYVKANKLLDYGAGKQLLKQYLPKNLPIFEYDPAIPEISSNPEPCDLVVCLDVLEHIEPEYIDDVLDDLKRVIKRVGFFTIATGPAKKLLPDGRNAHILQRPLSWWVTTLEKRFIVQHIQKFPYGYSILIYALHD